MTKPTNNLLLINFLIVVISALLFIPFLGNVHLFDWDEINFAECAREMIVSNDYLNVQIKFQPFWEKPPLFIWMQVLSMKVFGINEFAARFPNAVCGIVSLLLIYNIGRKLYSSKFGLLWVLVYAGSLLPHFYFRSGIIDPWFNLFIFISLYYFYKMHLVDVNNSRSRIWMGVLWGFFTGLAILTKGPVAFLIIGIVVGILYVPSVVNFMFPKIGIFKRVPLQIRFSEILVFLLVVIITGSSWFIAQIIDGHWDMVVKFIEYQVRLFSIPDAGHGGHWTYHFIVLFFGVFPASVFAVLRIWKVKGDNDAQRLFHQLMIVLFWCVLILFTIVKTKIIHYSSLCYLPLTFMATMAIYAILENKLKWNRVLNIVLIVIGFLYAIVVSTLPIIEKNKQKIIESGVIKDDFAVSNLAAEVTWTGLEWLIGVILVLGIVAVILLHYKKKFKAAFITLFIASNVFIFSSILVFPYRIEKFSQGAIIEFYKSKANENCYVLNSGYFSYAPAFYTFSTPNDYVRPMWMITGDIDRPFYLVLKEPHYKKYQYLVTNMKMVMNKNGWIVLLREPKH